MKYQFNLLFLIIILFSIKLFPQIICNNQVYICDPNKKYPYRICNSETGDKAICCYNDPNYHQPTCEDYEEGYHLMKIPIPICLEFQYDPNVGPQEPETLYTKCYPGKVEGKEVYRNEYTQDDCDEAVKRWNCICNKQDEPCECKIYVRFSNDYRDFKLKKDDDWPHDYGIKYISTESKCPSPCDNAIIYLNYSDKFYLNQMPVV